ncbi:hypothetical protein M422DRAFT_242941 [Sphaerobolus stellatus SS14]|nr:hypothetical protein M422DRAFT_242941 [Sphaerobolus stellatus SS14]
MVDVDEEERWLDPDVVRSRQEHLVKLTNTGLNNSKNFTCSPSSPLLSSCFSIMNFPSLKLVVQQIHTQEYPTIQCKLLFHEDEDWKSWLKEEQAVYTNWHTKKELQASNEFALLCPQHKLLFSYKMHIESNRKQTYDWNSLYDCAHAGQP